MMVVEDLSPVVGVAAACEALGVPRASFYRLRRSSAAPQAAASRPRIPPRSLSERERRQVLEVLHSERFVDKAPAEVYATLLDEGDYLCSVRTMYRILGESNEVRERRNQLRHPQYKKPELLATGPNQVWSWDITKLLGPAKWTYFYLYEILDIYSRYVVGWMVASGESAALAKRLIWETVGKQVVDTNQLIIHSDRGPSMKSHSVGQLMATLGITKSHSRPHVSNDNPFSESHFKTLKYRPEFPSRFGCQEDARSFCGEFFDWYNNEHYHSGIGFLTPAMVHYGLADVVLADRQRVLDAAYAAHPERFVKKRPSPSAVPKEVWINPPQRGGDPITETSTQQTETDQLPLARLHDSRNTNFDLQLSQSS
jgi:putative transposase